jgi:hypothetical protein
MNQIIKGNTNIDGSHDRKRPTKQYQQVSTRLLKLFPHALSLVSSLLALIFYLCVCFM